jgi:hypothetical protein
MNRKYLGDSFDIVKRFWAERLANIAPLLAHPKFVPLTIKTDFEKMVAIPVLRANEMPDGPFGLFLDPDTGIPLPTAASQKPSVSHAPISFIAAELRRLRPRYLICFDQSHDRKPGLDRPMQRQRKLTALQSLGVASFYYLSHAPFLFASNDVSDLEAVRSRLVQSGIPEWRFENVTVTSAVEP